MNTKKELSKVSALESALYVNDLIQKAKILINSENEIDQLAGAVIFSGMTEEFADNLYTVVSIQSKLHPSSTFKLLKEKKDINNNITNLGASIFKLKCYEFPIKKEIIKTLKRFKKSRDLLFHCLLKLTEKGLNIKYLSTRIQLNSLLFMFLYFDFEKELIKSEK